MKKRLDHRPAVFSFLLAVAGLFLCLTGLLRSAQKTAPTEAPLQSHILSHADWWQSQYGSSKTAWTDAFGEDYQNSNSGPACAVMVINYKKRARISADLGSFSDSRYPKIHTDARWKFCRANAGKGYPGGFADDDQAEVSGRDLVDVLGSEDIPVLLHAGKSEVTFDRIATAIGRYSLVICRVDPASYFADEKPGGGRWTVVYGYDGLSVYVNDPGRPEGRTKKVARRDFLKALQNADRGTNPVLLECVVMVGNYPDGWHADTRSRMFVEYYKGVAPEIGFPFDNGGTYAVHAVGLCIVQDFLKPPADPSTAEKSTSLLCLNPALGRIFWV
ncbi:MAG: hypothetical protein Q8O91_01605, partial [Candidatus Aminicenantes bacterium]|nr:hypothetical protein [Candidatus Aminicenantes bacterium]